MSSKNIEEELGAMEQAKAIIQSKPKEAYELLESIIVDYKAAGKTIAALETRRWQCFGLFSNLDFECARNQLKLLVDEANQFKMPRYIGIAKMYEGVISLEIGRGDDAIEFLPPLKKRV